jgi:citrate lyase subunit gamma (acyl carrier protein)
LLIKIIVYKFAPINVRRKPWRISIIWQAYLTINQNRKNKIMEIKNANAGTLESGDILIRISPAEVEGLQINLESTVAYQFGAQIKRVISDTLKGLGVDNAVVDATDKGALDCTIRARVTAAAVRATGKDVWAD